MAEAIRSVTETIGKVTKLIRNATKSIRNVTKSIRNATKLIRNATKLIRNATLSIVFGPAELQRAGPILVKAFNTLTKKRSKMSAIDHEESVCWEELDKPSAAYWESPIVCPISAAFLFHPEQRSIASAER